MTVNKIMELARFEFRRYGFRCDTPILSRASESIVATFELEPAAGQASFSQVSVACYVRIWDKTQNVGWEYDIPVNDKISIELGVRYDHHFGSNGICRAYILSVDSLFGEWKLRAAA